VKYLNKLWNRTKIVLDIEKHKPKLKTKIGQAVVDHACNPSYSGGRDQEDHGSKPAQANSSM
jgi:hypothetical protein